MANLRRTLTPQNGLSDAPARAPGIGRRLALLVAVAAAGLLLAWIDGGEEPLHPIAQPVTLPEQPQ